MTVREATRPQLLAFVRTIRDHQSKRDRAAPSLVAVKARPVWRHEQTFDLDGQTVDVVPCASPLEFSRALVRHADGGGLTVLLSPGAGLSTDAMAKLFHGRVLDLDLWQIARGLFRAQRLDPRLRDKRWVAEALIEVHPSGGYEPAPAGMLTESIAWSQLLRHHLRLDREEPTLTDVLRWAMRPDRARDFAALSAERRAAYVEWITGRVGTVAARVLGMVSAGSGSTAVPASLALGVLHHAESGDELAKARLKFDVKVLGDDSDLVPSVARAWAAAAETIVRDDLRGDSSAVARGWSEEAEQLLAKVGAGDHAHRSDVLLLGRRQRQDRFAAALAAVVEESANPDALPRALTAVTDHALGPGESLGRALELAVKLARWTRARTPAGASTLEQAFRAYREHGSFVDWCRRRIAEHTSHARVGPALTKLLVRVDAWREEENRHFGELIARDATTYRAEGDVVPIEDVLDRLVVPLAASTHVLLLVLDGMALDVCHELLEPLTDEGWVECRPAAEQDRWSVLTAFPTVTEYCRASLFAGKLVRGAQGGEKKAFAAHAGLFAAAGDDAPVVFHKKDLDGNGVDGDPVEVVAGTDRRVVAVVLNTIDDLLAAGDKLRPEWTPETIKHLDHLLEAAREAKRTVVITADHGHVLERDMEYRGSSSNDESERWRLTEGEPGDGELRLRGPRVLAGGEAGIMAPWSERVRYKPKKGSGYHGGIAPQEVVVPLVVLRAIENVTDTALELPTLRPAWWDVGAVHVAPAPAPTRRRKPAKPAKSQPTLFETVAPATVLLQSERFAQRRKSMGGRRPPSEDHVRNIISALDQNGGTLTQKALARASRVAEARLGGLLAVLQRILNVDGYAVLAWDREADAITLDVDLLRAQFKDEE